MTNIPDDIMKMAREVVISERTGLNLAEIERLDRAATREIAR